MARNRSADSRSDRDNARIRRNTKALERGLKLMGAGGEMNRRDEYVHPPRTRNPLFNESYYFNFFNTPENVSGFVWIGRLPNQNEVNGVQLVYDGDNDGLVMFQKDKMPQDINDIKSGDMSIEILDPLKSLRIRSSGKMLRMKNPGGIDDPETLYKEADEGGMEEVEIDFTFKGLAPAHNSKNLHAGSVAEQMVDNDFGFKDLNEIRKVASNHYEQAGSYTGTMRIGDRSFKVGTVGHRDHSWGPRDWCAPKDWTWLSVEFGTEVGLNLCRIESGKIDMFLGYICREGRNYPLKSFKLETEFESDGHRQKEMRFSIIDTGDFHMDVEGHAINMINLMRRDGRRSSVVHEAMTEYEWNGSKSQGISEYLHRLS
ncbi:MAG: hypothetical protein JXA49_05575 [Actinobacteria bacterium]|nr:hypothetical protein [Actinomycetota bacterium]